MDEVVPGIKAGVTVTCDSVIRAKDGGYHSKRWCYQD